MAGKCHRTSDVIFFFAATKVKSINVALFCLDGQTIYWKTRLLHPAWKWSKNEELCTTVSYNSVENTKYGVGSSQRKEKKGCILSMLCHVIPLCLTQGHMKEWLRCCQSCSVPITNTKPDHTLLYIPAVWCLSFPSPSCASTLHRETEYVWSLCASTLKTLGSLQSTLIRVYVTPAENTKHLRRLWHCNSYEDIYSYCYKLCRHPARSALLAHG